MTSQDLYTMGHIASLTRENHVGPIKNMDVLLPFNEFLRDDLTDEDIGENSPVNFPLKNINKPSEDIVAVPYDIL